MFFRSNWKTVGDNCLSWLPSVQNELRSIICIKPRHTSAGVHVIYITNVWTLCIHRVQTQYIMYMNNARWYAWLLLGQPRFFADYDLIIIILLPDPKHGIIFPLRTCFLRRTVCKMFIVQRQNVDIIHVYTTYMSTYTYILKMCAHACEHSDFNKGLSITKVQTNTIHLDNIMKYKLTALKMKINQLNKQTCFISKLCTYKNY